MYGMLFYRFTRTIGKFINVLRNDILTLQKGSYIEICRVLANFLVVMDVMHYVTEIIIIAYFTKGFG